MNSSQAKAFGHFIEVQKSVLLKALRKDGRFEAIFKVGKPLEVLIAQNDCCRAGAFLNDDPLSLVPSPGSYS